MICRAFTLFLRGALQTMALRLKLKKECPVQNLNYRAENVLAAASILQDSGPYVAHMKPKCTKKRAFSPLLTTKRICQKETP